MTNEKLLKIYFENKHILQSRPWGEFKTFMGTKAIEAGNTQMTVHKVPLSPFKVGYLPKAKPEDINLERIFEAGKKANCIFVKLDVPHADENFKFQISNFKLIPGKSVFAQSTLLLDLTKSDEELLAAMHEKTRYNIGLARRKGVKVKIYDSARPGLEEGAVTRFIELQKGTAKRQGFFVHSDHYYKTCFDILSRENMAYLVEAKVENETAASWMLFRYGDVLYYPYGESNYKFRAYMPSNIVMWEAIQLGKKLGCKVFDLWGASQNPEDEKDPWHGFTRFKMSFGATHISLSPTYDLIINTGVYELFNMANNLRWNLLRFGKK